MQLETHYIGIRAIYFTLFKIFPPATAEKRMSTKDTNVRLALQMDSSLFYSCFTFYKANGYFNTVNS